MPISPTYPGVYIEEIPSGVRTIIGVATSITAFIGTASRGPTNDPVRIQSFADFERQFGGLWVKSAMSYAVQQYFLNGGTDAIIIRVVPGDAEKAKLPAAAAADAADAAKDAADQAINIATDATVEEIVEIAKNAAKAANTAAKAAVVAAAATVANTPEGSDPATQATTAARQAKNAATQATTAAQQATTAADAVDATAARTAAQQATTAAADAATAARTAAQQATTAAAIPTEPNIALSLEAASEGKWVNDWIVEVDYQTKKIEDTKLFNLSILQPAQESGDDPIVLESFRNVSVDPDSPRYVATVLEQQSNFVRWFGTISEGSERPPATDPDNQVKIKFAGGVDGNGVPSYNTPEEGYLGSPAEKTGIYALEKADLFNLLCIPPRVRNDIAVAEDDGGISLLADALKYCKKRRAMLIVDPRNDWTTPAKVKNGTIAIDNTLSFLRDENAIIYYPNVKLTDPLKENRLQEFPPCGVVAGIFARTDAQRGVWKAPAGIEATLSGVREIAYKMTDGENGQLNPIGVNCLRSFPVYGNIVWGARTLEGADQLASEWKYVPVRRLALFLEESLYRGTQWVVFEPNDEPLWAQIRLNIGAFMNNLFRQGAFQGSSPKDAYFVKCDKDTTTQNDIDRGIVNIIVGYAPLKPAEFVIIKFQQIAGNIAT